MTIFQLVVFGCVTMTNAFTGDYTKTCSWRPGGLFVTKGACLRAAPKIGSPIFSDVADGKVVDDVKCSGTFVQE